MLQEHVDNIHEQVRGHKHGVGQCRRHCRGNMGVVANKAGEHHDHDQVGDGLRDAHEHQHDLNQNSGEQNAKTDAIYALEKLGERHAQGAKDKGDGGRGDKGSVDGGQVVVGKAKRRGQAKGTRKDYVAHKGQAHGLFAGSSRHHNHADDGQNKRAKDQRQGGAAHHHARKRHGARKVGAGRPWRKSPRRSGQTW